MDTTGTALTKCVNHAIRDRYNESTTETVTKAGQDALLKTLFSIPATERERACGIHTVFI